MTSHRTARKEYRSARRWSALAAVALLLVLFVAGAVQAACVCGTGKMTNWFPGTAPITIDGTMSDWSSITANPNNNICDGYPSSALSDLDAPIQSTGRDLMQFTYTFDSNYVYAYTQRYASDSNTDNFIYYADTNNDGLMETGEPVVVVSWQGSNRTVGVYLGTYQAYYAGGDPMVCTTGKSAGQSCSSGYADGYHLPGTIVNLPASGHPTYTGQWGSVSGTEMEWKVSWADLGLGTNPGTPFTFHVASTNSQPGAGSFPAQVDDNMGGCGGKGGTTQYAGVGIAPAQTLTLSSATSYSTTHTLTNTGNGADNFTLSSTVSGSNNPTPTVTYSYQGTSFTDTKNLGASFTLAAGASITVTVTYSFASSPASKNYTVTTTAKSDFDPTVTAQVVDSLTSQQAVVLVSNTVGGYASFSYFGGSNGLPANLVLTSSAGNDPVASPGYVVNPAQGASITQAITSGWLFGSGSCNYASSGSPLAGTNYSFAPSGTNVVLTINKAAFTGDNVICTFANLKLPSITLSKLLGGARVSDSDQFSVQLISGGSVIASSSSAGTGSQVTSGTGWLSYTATGTGASYSLGETKSAGPTPANVYAATLSCTNNGYPASSPSALGESFTPGIGDNYLCWITNTPPLLRVQLQTVSGTGSFGYLGNNGVGSFTLDTGASNPASQSFVLAALNTATALAQSTPSGWRLNGASCRDAAGAPVTSTLAGDTLTVAATAVQAGVSLVCSFEDVLEPKLLVTKSADSPNVAPGQLVTYTSLMSNSAGNALSVTVTDTLSPYLALGLNSYGAGVPFQMIEGSTPSGLTLGTPAYSRDNGATWSYVPVSGGGGAPAGYDANITNWRIPMSGTMNAWAGGSAPYPYFTVTYKALVR
ncbi:hypothetical protein GMLC_13810 [Geomonas limicola]|uniref:DUF11 domain-containing protein n=1 Tax=Geomonas limicola TaxID=2740186 RepID=A0A6V8N5G2_9BACT|nr:hypothetical protein [Geomonas limicola]GFO67802.1 hypothetical protein GMLC_13810 [Geomonas limicola]